MSRAFALAMTALLGSVAPATIPQGTVQTSAQREEQVAAQVRDLVRRYVDARERRDAGAIGALFTDDADQLTSSGEWRRGRDDVVRGALASSARTGGSRSIRVERVRLLGPDIALADGRYEISGLQGGATRQMWTTFVVRLEQGAWRICAIRNMLPAAPAAASWPTSPPASPDHEAAESLRGPRR